MTREQFLNLIKQKILVLDGATGVNLIKAGMPMGACPEQWILENSDVLIELQTDYINAGSNIIYAPTFTANRIKLSEYGLENRIGEINEQLVNFSKKAVAKTGYRAYVAGNLTMTGRQLYPIGTLPFEELVSVYKEQLGYMLEAGIDMVVVETMMSLSEARAALIATKEVCDLPAIVSMTYNENGRTLFGTSPKVAVTVLQNLGADAIGVNCSTGPDKMIPIVKEIKEYSNIPILAKPNAGMPELIDGQTVYSMKPEAFAEYGELLVEAGANMIGGCCGTGKAHIMALAQTVKSMIPLEISETKKSLLASEEKLVEIDINGSFLVVGERINPTGKKNLQEELRQGKLDMVVQMAQEQAEQGAAVLDVNMGMNGIDEKEMMLKVIYELTGAVNLPLCIDSSNIEVIEAALRIYPGRALVNSVSLETEKLERLLPLAKKYGAMFILLPLSGQGLPKTKEEKMNIIHTVMEKAISLGFTKEDMIVDGLVTTVGANPNAAMETLEIIEYCKKEIGIATICGLSNISFGLPQRIYINTAFLTMAIAKGLTMAIANPSEKILINAALASDLLLKKEGSDIRYIENVKEIKHAQASLEQYSKQKRNKESSMEQKYDVKKEASLKIYEDVLKGNKHGIVEDVRSFHQAGNKPEAIIEQYLIPAINEVGVLFDKQKYFLPQLMASAKAMELAITYLEPFLEQKDQGKKAPVIVIATVEGDIHDIGKNLVVLMLKNYGYHVIDLGKDISKEIIVDTAVKENAAIIGLSALMTTTMVRMKDVVEYAKEKGTKAKIIIGGAVVTESFAKEIGADDYAKDARQACKVIESLLK